MNQVNLNNKKNYLSNMNSRKKISLILAILGIVLIVLAFIIPTSSSNNKESINLDNVFDPNRPIVVKKDDKYEYITSEGEILLNQQFLNAYDFFGDYAVVRVENPDTESKAKSIYQIIDRKGSVKLSSFNFIDSDYYQTYNVWLVDNVLYNSKFQPISSKNEKVEYVSNGYFEYSNAEKNESGIMTYTGKKIFSIPEKSISVTISSNEFDTEDLYAEIFIVGEKQKNFIISLKTGEILFTVPDESYSIYAEDNGIFSYYSGSGLDQFKTSKYLFFMNNELVYQTDEGVKLSLKDYKNKILEVDYGVDYKEKGKTQQKYYYDIQSKELLEKMPFFSTTANEETEAEGKLNESLYGFRSYYDSGKYGVVSGEKEIVPCEYDEIEFLNINLFNYMKSKGMKLVLLEKDNQQLLYDLNKSETITTFDTYYLRDYDDSTFVEYTTYEKDNYKETGTYVYNVLTRKEMSFSKTDDIDVYSNYITVKKDDQIIYYNTNFKQIFVEAVS